MRRRACAACAAGTRTRLGARVRLLAVVGERDGVELAHAVVARQHDAGVLPRDGAARLHLRPRDFAALPLAQPALRHEVVDAAHAGRVARVPVLHRGVLDLRARARVQLHHRRVQLVLVVRRRGAALQVRHVAVVLRHDERALKLARLGGVDAEVGGQLHGRAHALGDVAERAVAEHRAVQRREVVVRHRHLAGGGAARVSGCARGRGGRVAPRGDANPSAVGRASHHAAHVLLHQLGVLADGLGHGAEDDARLAQLLAEGGCD